MTTDAGLTGIRLTELANRLHPVAKQQIGRAAPEFLLRARGRWSNPQLLYAAALRAVASRGFHGTQQQQAAVYLIAVVLLTGEVGAAEAEILAPIDRLGDLGQLEQMQMQILMGRRSKLAEILSNVLEHLEQTSQTISGNMK